MMRKYYQARAYHYLRLMVLILALAFASVVGIQAADPASVEVVLSNNFVAPNDTITVTPIARDADGQIITDPSFRYDIRIEASGMTTGNPPVMLDGQRIKFPKLVKRLIGHNPSIDPDGEYADADPMDPNYGKETGGLYTVTATLIGRGLSGSADVTVLPTGTASVTVKTKQYGEQLVKGLGDMASALAIGTPQAIEDARRRLRAIAANPDNSFDVLHSNQVMAPPNGYPVTPAQVMAAGFTAEADDSQFSTTLDAIQNQIRQAVTRINQINPASVTQADVDALQAIADRYREISDQLAQLQPGTLGVTQQGEKLNVLVRSEMTRLFDMIIQKSIDIANRIPSTGATGALTFISTTFSILTDLSGFAMGNIIEGGITLANSMMNIMLADLINRQSPGGLTIDWVQGSASTTFVCPMYPGTFIGGSGFSRDASQMKVLLIGCVDSQLLRNLLTLRPAGDLAAAIRLIFKIISIAQGLWREQRVAAVVIPDGVTPEGELWEMTMTFNRGWPRVNQGRLPCTGTIIVFNLERGRFAAVNRTFLGQCG